MNKPEKINNQNRILEIARLCIEIQNKGIATAFFSIHGHVSFITFSLHAPRWESNRNPEYIGEPSSKEELDAAISVLKEIIENGEESIPGFSDKKKKERERKINQLNKLKKELGVS